MQKYVNFIAREKIAEKLSLTEREAARLATLLCRLNDQGVDFSAEPLLLQIAQASTKLGRNDKKGSHGTHFGALQVIVHLFVTCFLYTLFKTIILQNTTFDSMLSHSRPHSDCSEDQNFGRGGVLKDPSIAPCTTPGGKYIWTCEWRCRNAEEHSENKQNDTQVQSPRGLIANTVKYVSCFSARSS